MSAAPRISASSDRTAGLHPSSPGSGPVRVAAIGAKPSSPSIAAIGVSSSPGRKPTTTLAAPSAPIGMSMASGASWAASALGVGVPMKAACANFRTAARVNRLPIIAAAPSAQ